MTCTAATLVTNSKVFSLVHQQLDGLEESYLRQHASEGDLNELLFLTKDPLFFPSNAHR